MDVKIITTVAKVREDIADCDDDLKNIWANILRNEKISHLIASFSLNVRKLWKY